MKKYLNTLYLTTDGTYIHKERETVVIEIDGKKAAQFPIHTIGNIFCFGRVMVSPALMGFCGEKNIGLAFFTWYGKFLARVLGPVSGNVLLRREQYRRADDEMKCLEICRNIVGAKVASSRVSLQRFIRNNSNLPCVEAVSKVISTKKEILRKIKNASDVNVLRGYEGEAAHCYFSVFNNLILQQKEGFEMKGRSRRPPLDKVNALLSFIYTLIKYDCVSACEGVGLDPAVGYLHRDRPGRFGLALDIMEEFRAFLGDRLVLSLINRGQIKGKEFTITESGAVQMSDSARKTVLTAYQERKKEELEHPFLKESAPVGLFFHIQAQLFARYLRSDIDFYPPFVWR